MSSRVWYPSPEVCPDLLYLNLKGLLHRIQSPLGLIVYQTGRRYPLTLIVVAQILFDRYFL